MRGGMAFDLVNPADIKAAYLKLGERWRELNTLVNMAGATGAPQQHHFADFPDADWYHSLDVGTLAAMRCSREALPWLRRAPWARIIHISSIASQLTTPELVTYGMAKAALQALGKTMAMTLAPEGILVNTITPGAVVTEAFRQWMRDAGAEARGLNVDDLRHCQQWVQEDFGGKTNSWLGRCASPAEIATVIAFVGSKANTYMTGANINVDGDTDFQ